MSKNFIEGLIERPFINIRQTEPLSKALEKLAKNNIGALPVLNSAGKLYGIISERDIIKALYKYENPNFLENKVHIIMTKNVISCGKTVRSNDLMTLMTDNKIRHIPIVENGLALGIVSIGDVVKRLLEKYQSESEYLKKYINS